MTLRDRVREIRQRCITAGLGVFAAQHGAPCETVEEALACIEFSSASPYTWAGQNYRAGWNAALRCARELVAAEKEAK
jgi:hypothetical protein